MPKIKSIVTRKRLALVLLVLLLVGAFFWWTKVFNDPENVFWGMMDSSLSAGSVTRHVVETSAGSTTDRYTRLQTGSTNAVQDAEITKQATTAVTKETIGTPTTDYARYATIETGQKSANGLPVDFSGVEGIWGKSPDPVDGQTAQVQYFTQAILGTVPFASLNPAARSELISFMKANNVYNVSLSDVKKTKQDGREIYTYNVKINPMAYFKMLQLFVKKLGLADIPGLDPAQYNGVADLETQFSVDKNSRQLVEIKYISSGQQESYSDYGLTTPIEIPKDTIPIDELQTRIQNIH